MRSKVFLTMAILALFCLPVTQAQLCPDNTLVNPGFEDWNDFGPTGPPDSWTLRDTGFTATQEGTTVDAGLYSVNLTLTSQTTQYFEQIVPIVAGEIYTCNFRYYDNDPAGQYRMWFAWMDSCGDYLSSGSGPSYYTSDAAMWQDHSFTTAAAPIGAYYLRVEIRMYDISAAWDGDCTVYIDSFEVCGVSGTVLPTCSPVPPTETPSGPTNTPLPTSTPGTISPIKINEIFYDTPGTDTSTFVELYYAGGISLDGYSLVGVNGNGGLDYATIDLTGYSIPADGFFVVAEDTGVANYDLIDILVDFQNGPDSVQLRMGATVVDAIGYGDFSSAVFAGEGDPAIDFQGSEFIAHSRIPDGVDTDDNLTDFVCGTLTSGVANVICAETPTPAATDTPAGPTNTPAPVPSVSIYDIQYNITPPFESPYETQIVKTRGVVTAFSATSSYMFMQSNTSPWNGILVYLPMGFTDILNRGDLVEVQGEIKEYYGLTEFSPTDTVTVISPGAAFLAQVVPCGDLEVVIATPNPVAESWEGMFVRVENVAIVGTPDFGEWRVQDVSGIAVVDDLYPTTYVPLPATLLDFVQGPLNFSYDEYKIAPRDDNDIQETGGQPTFTPSPIPSETPFPTAAPSISIYDIQYNTTPPFESPYMDSYVITQGYVTAFSAGSSYMFIQENTSPWNGILVYLPFGFTDTFNRGDLVEVEGLVTEYYGLTEISPTSRAVLISSGSAFAAQVVTCGDLEVVISTPNPVAEGWEGMLVRVENVDIVGTPDFGEWRVQDMSGIAVVDNLYSHSYTPVPATLLDYVQGPLNFSYDEYKIAPRDDADILESGAPTPTPVATNTPGGPTPTPASIPTSGPLGLGLLVLAITGILGFTSLRKK